MKALLVFCILLASCQNNSTTETDPDTTHQQVDHSDSNTTSKVNPPDSNYLIVAGERIGKVKIGEDVSSLEVLGRPDISDAAMGKAWLTWKGKRDEHNNATELNVYTTYKDNTMRQKTVQQIRTTSSDFSTSQNNHVYSSLSEIEKEFPSLKKAASFNEDGRDIVVYDAVKEGIAFEIASAGQQKICTGIIVHEKGRDVTEIYIMLHPGMKRY